MAKSVMLASKNENTSRLSFHVNFFIFNDISGILQTNNPQLAAVMTGSSI
jgi:hypothetical protein